MAFFKPIGAASVNGRSSGRIHFVPEDDLDAVEPGEVGGGLRIILKVPREVLFLEIP